MGQVWVFSSNVDTDAIIPAPHIATTDEGELGKHCMEGSAIPDFARRVRPGDFIVAGANFGCGSSREHAPLSIRGSGVACVIARSFARIFFRNSINIGLPILECPEAVDALRPGDGIAVDPVQGTVTAPDGRIFRARPLPPFVMEILQAGGLMEFTKRRLAHERAGRNEETPKCP